jgi:diguanylate cyclase (GGDEF)-like protein
MSRQIAQAIRLVRSLKSSDRFGDVDHDERSQLMNPRRLWPHLATGRPLAANRRSGRARTALLGGIIVVLGLTASAFLASEWRASVLHTNRKSFESAATELSSTLESKLNANIVLTRTMRAIATMEPDAGETRFLQWYRQLQRGGPATPGVVAALVQPVPASGLAAFRRRAEADPAFRALLGGRFQIVPPGNRSSYCLTRADVGTSEATSLYPPLLDYCAPVLPGIGRSPYVALMRTVRDTGSFIVTPLAGVGGSLVAIGVAVYRRGAPVATVSARRAALTGFIATTFDSATLIRSLLAGRRSLAVALYHRNADGQQQLIARAGTTTGDPSPVYSQGRYLGEGWQVEVAGTTVRSLSAQTQGLFVLGSGLLVTVLVLLLYRVPARSRQRAWDLVGEKTGELEYSALHDPLTDLPNRGLVLDRAEQILARARRLHVPVTALFMDLDDFKQINDRYGHQTGDDVLRQVGARLKNVLRDSDTVGRLGGDEFVMLVDSVGLDAAPELVAERILDVLRQPIELPRPAPSPISVTASIGIATGLPACAEDLMQDADLALYKVKGLGKDGYAKFESAMHTAARDRMHLEMDLAEALDGDQFFLVYQPMLDLESEQVVGVEALLRWRHPARGVIQPDAFIPIAEDNGLIVALGRWVLEQACAQGAAWHHRGYPLTIAVNVSARQLERTAFVEEVRAALHGSGLDPAALTLEITETVLMRKPDVTALLLSELKTLGVRIAVDDFGTGYSSLAYLRQFPVDSLKIDRTFINGLAQSSESHALTHTLIHLGKALGLETLAEGVENQSQVRELQREGCDLAQGFLFARPLDPDVLERFLRDNASGRALPTPEIRTVAGRTGRC